MLQEGLLAQIKPFVPARQPIRLLKQLPLPAMVRYRTSGKAVPIM